MRADKKRERDAAKIAEMLGIEAPKLTGPTFKTQREDNSREAEAVLSYIRRPQLFVDRTCSCNKDFKVNRADVSCCSDICRARELAELGVEWDFSRNSGDRWKAMQPNVPEPLIVPNEALSILAELGIT